MQWPRRVSIRVCLFFHRARQLFEIGLNDHIHCHGIHEAVRTDGELLAARIPTWPEQRAARDSGFLDVFGNRLRGA